MIGEISVIKALFFDIDGTLLTSAGRLSASTKFALRESKKKGICIFVATARPPRLKRMLSLDEDEFCLIGDGGAFYNGGCIMYRGEKHYTPISASATERTINVVESLPDVNLALQMVHERHRFRYFIPSAEYPYWGIDTDDVDLLAGYSPGEVVKILAFSSTYPLTDLFLLLRDAIGSQANIYPSGSTIPRFVEVVASGTNKRLACERIASAYGLMPSEVAVFGDDNNDVEMLAGFEHSVAMGNATQRAREAAKHVTRSNDDDGIHYALTQILRII